MSASVVTIADPVTGSRASTAPSLGFNCFSYQAPLRGRLIETLWAHPELLGGGQRPSGSGIPILFPFGGRMPGTSFEHQGATYQLEEGDGRGNAIHGFVMSRPWRVVDQQADSVTGEFQASVDDPSLLARWPADFRVTCRYALGADGLLSEFVVDNPSDRVLPFGLATHAYFRIPPGGGPEFDEAEQTVLRVPVSDQWELAGLIPTGRRLGAGDFADMPRGMELRGRVFDNVFTGLAYDAGRTTTSVHNPAVGCTLVQTFDDSFRHAVVYTPPHREAICIEPYTALPNYFRLEQTVIETGVRHLQPGEQYRTRIELRLIDDQP